MLKAKSFCFKKYSYSLEKLKFNFDYELELNTGKFLKFREVLTFSHSFKNFSKKEIDLFLESIHLILGISYYKLYCPKIIKIPYSLSKEQADFWNSVYKKGLGEFIYKNKLDFKKIAKFPYKNERKTKILNFDLKESAIIGIGGGKDSIVSMEILKNFPNTPFYIETQKEDPIIMRVIKESGKGYIKVKRELDKKIFKKHEGSYNGHIPISAIFAFIGIFTAYLYDYKYVIVGNEKSSNFGNIKYKGLEINHQWSKSEEFELLFQDYVRKFITPDIIYFSILRRFHEIKISKMFSKYKKYFNIFSSCNKNFKVFEKRNNEKRLWCNNCPKCAFVFLMLSAFLSKKELINIFKENLYQKEELISLFGEILGFGDKKPFDCVGTFEEAQVALFLASKKFSNDIVIKKYLKDIKEIEKKKEKVFKLSFTKATPSFFNFFGLKKVCIIGYGREGKINEKYLKENHPEIEIGIIDEGIDKNSFSKQHNYEFGIKTSGISKRRIEIPYTTGTNIFFSKNKNFVIGITGTKGKSTTSTLIYEILKADKRKVKLIGNIGKPMLESLLSKRNKEDIFVIELSSYMLDDIFYSPNIAVLLNLSPEHMDYHQGIKNYYLAKENIFNFQNSNDIAVRFPFKEKIVLNKREIPLLGNHNMENVKAAVKVARILKVKESSIKKGIKNFKPLKHRMNFVGNFNGIIFYDDAAGTTPLSTIKAIEFLKKVDTIMLGGEDRGYDFSKLEKVIRKYKIKNLVLFPETGERIIKNLKGFNFIKTKNMEAAVKFAFEKTEKGKICLLSTASPSYSLWKNFDEKGDLFKSAIKKYKKNGKK